MFLANCFFLNFSTTPVFVLGVFAWCNLLKTLRALATVKSSVIVGVSVRISELVTVNVSFNDLTGVVGKFEGTGSWSGVVFELFRLSVEV